MDDKIFSDRADFYEESMLASQNFLQNYYKKYVACI